MLYQIENWHDLRDRFRKELDETVCRMKFGVMISMFREWL